MNFSEELNQYMQLLKCSPKNLADASGLSTVLISRYLNGKRVPRIESNYFDKMVDGLFLLAQEKKKPLSKNVIKNTLKNSIISRFTYYDDFIHNFNVLLTELKINISDLANAIGYDASFISRMRKKDRKPADLDNFINTVADYIVNHYTSQENIMHLSSVMQCSADDLLNTLRYKKIVLKWLTTSHANNTELVHSFLNKLDTFELDDYLGSEFQKMKVPNMPILLKGSKTFYGISGRKQAEAEFLKTTLLSKSKGPIFFYSNLPIAELGKDEQFKKQWVLVVAMLLKKGLHLNMVHNVDRPIGEMLLGIENWLPLYMTGAISPYYYKDTSLPLFLISHCSSGSIALSGEYFNSKENGSKYYLTTKKEELNYAHEKSKHMLAKAKPLMKIFKEEDHSKLNEWMQKEDTSKIIKIESDKFKNIDFSICNNKWVMVHKKNASEIYFVIYQDKLRNAIETFLRNEKT